MTTFVLKKNMDWIKHRKNGHSLDRVCLSKEITNTQCLKNQSHIKLDEFRSNDTRW